LCDKAAVLRDTIKWTHFVCYCVGFMFTAPEDGEINQKPSSRAHSRTVADAVHFVACMKTKQTVLEMGS